jgi:hypothetical protein
MKCKPSFIIRLKINIITLLFEKNDNVWRISIPRQKKYDILVK